MTLGTAVTTAPLLTRLSRRSRMVGRRMVGRWATPHLLHRRFEEHRGYALPLDAPTTMTEKLFARMILLDRQRDDSITPLVDKYLVRRTVAEVVGPDYLVPLLWHGTDADDIPFDALPSPAVLKPTHMTGGVIILREDTDRAQTSRDAAGWLRESMYWPSREYQYHRVTRRLIVEQFIDDGVPHGPLDYSFWCFGGEPVLVQMRNHTRDINCFVDLDWTPQAVYTAGERTYAPERPDTLGEMTDIARALSAPFEFVRVDLYDIHGTVYVGELTFTPASGRLRFASPEWDTRLGDLWDFDPSRPVLPPEASDAFRPHLLPPLPTDTRTR